MALQPGDLSDVRSRVLPAEACFSHDLHALWDGLCERPPSRRYAEVLSGLRTDRSLSRPLRGEDAMKITTTYGKILEIGRWDAFCAMSGTNPWCVAEGRVSSDEEVKLTLEEARQICLLPSDEERS